MTVDVHKAQRLPDLPNFGIPLCWVAEQVGKGTPIAEQGELWAISLDHEALPAHSVDGAAERVTCPCCLELIHA